MRANLFSSWLNTLLTLFAFYLIWLIVPPMLQWAILDANWVGTTRADCTGGRLLGVHPAALRPVHVRLLPAGTALARGPDGVAGRLGVAPLFISRFPAKRCTA
jgi:general L-amino acid transport system permease protein